MPNLWTLEEHKTWVRLIAEGKSYSEVAEALASKTEMQCEDRAFYIVSYISKFTRPESLFPTTLDFVVNLKQRLKNEGMYSAGNSGFTIEEKKKIAEMKSQGSDFHEIYRYFGG